MKTFKRIVSLLISAIALVSCSFDSGELDVKPENGTTHELLAEFEMTQDTRSQVYRAENKMDIFVVAREHESNTGYYGGSDGSSPNGHTHYVCQIDTDFSTTPYTLSPAVWTSKMPITLSEAYAKIYAVYPSKIFRKSKGMFFNLENMMYDNGTKALDPANNTIYLQMPSKLTIADPVYVRLNGVQTNATTPQTAYPKEQQVDWMFGVNYDSYRNLSSFTHPIVNINDYKVKLYMRHTQALIRIIVYKQTYQNSYEASNPGSGATSGVINQIYFGDITKDHPGSLTQSDTDVKIFKTGDMNMSYVDGTFDGAKTSAYITWDLDANTKLTDQDKIDADTFTTYIVPTEGAPDLVRIGLMVDGEYHATKPLSTYKWEAGKVYTYTVNIGNQPLEIEDAGVFIQDWTYVTADNTGVVF